MFGYTRIISVESHLFVSGARPWYEFSSRDSSASFLKIFKGSSPMTRLDQSPTLSICGYTHIHFHFHSTTLHSVFYKDILVRKNSNSRKRQREAIEAQEEAVIFQPIKFLVVRFFRWWEFPQGKEWPRTRGRITRSRTAKTPLEALGELSSATRRLDILGDSETSPRTADGSEYPPSASLVPGYL